MPTYTFEIVINPPTTLQQVESAIANVPGVRLPLTKSALGVSYLLWIDTPLSEDDAMAEIKTALANLNVTVKKVVHPKPRKR